MSTQEDREADAHNDRILDDYIANRRCPRFRCEGELEESIYDTNKVVCGDCHTEFEDVL